MIISPEYGPQFDPKDGTTGKLQLVKRWVLAYPDKQFGGWILWRGRDGRDTKATKREADELAQAFVNENRGNGLVPEGLQAREAWCYPSHHDFAGFIDAYAWMEKFAGVGI